MNPSIALASVFFLLVLAACKTGAVHDEQPARLISGSDASLTELRRVVSEMLSGAEVALAEDALNDSSLLVVERRRIRSVEHPPLLGRDLGVPERFQLVKSGGRCFLIHENSGARSELHEAECVAE